MKVSGQLRKMTYEPASPVEYFLSLDEQPTPLKDCLGKPFTMRYLGKITCINCGRATKKSYDQGYCFPCARDLPENAMCSVRPELCQHEFGNDADKEFFKAYCKVDHFVYLSLTSGVKVGVTRHFNIPDRWIDQGAVKAVVIARTPQRLYAGQIEVALAKSMSDKTNWRKMLKGETEEADLETLRESVLSRVPEELKQYTLPNETVQGLSYPVLSVPEKINSHNLDKIPEFSSILTGIKGQYLIFEDKVINLRKYTGYHVEISAG
ncbi:MAG: DUF2797 domain-containing protein [Candidatus Nitrohelix vancouverensis]|uniref:DUF2797 domain-containing protein n=1 Tax=Candidatus Nitrohelix vancouverensis TaxID=2705534 RepID=A0A7T0C2U4_9BACT|nr:MAG: DUF2797 domain-containing protein [Candidatus Nitrohelix vancouverensis]